MCVKNRLQFTPIYLAVKPYLWGLAMHSAAALSPRFVRRTILGEQEYRVNFKQIDCDVLDSLASDEACSVTPLMGKIYIRLIRAPLPYWEREGVLRFTGEERAGDSLTAWEQLRELTGVSNSTLSKALAWLHETGIIGYDARKNGVGIRIFINRAASSIRSREGQKNLRLVPTPNKNHPAPQDGTPFKEEDSEKNLDVDINPRASAREENPADEQHPVPCHHREQADSRINAGTATVFTAVAAANSPFVISLVRQIVNEIKPEITAAVKRETSGTRDWFLNYALPKATRVAQRETYDLLRAYGVVAQKGGRSADVGKCAAPAETGQGREAEISKVATFIAEASKVVQQVISVASESPKLDAACQTADRELNGLYDKIVARERLTPEEIEDKLAAIDDTLMKAAWESSDPAECDTMLNSARAELRRYEARMEREVFEETVQRRVTAKLREKFGLPRLSLFYL